MAKKKIKKYAAKHKTTGTFLGLFSGGDINDAFEHILQSVPSERLFLIDDDFDIVSVDFQEIKDKDDWFSVVVLSWD